MQPVTKRLSLLSPEDVIIPNFTATKIGTVRVTRMRQTAVQKMKNETIRNLFQTGPLLKKWVPTEHSNERLETDACI